MMSIKSFFRLSTAAALLLGLSACNNELDEPQAAIVPEDAVQLTASIGTPFSTRSTPMVDGATNFTEGDEIYVRGVSDSSGATSYSAFSIYRLTGDTWAPMEGRYILWKTDRMNFQAFYPASVVSDMDTQDKPFPEQFPLQVPLDQSTGERMALADLMGIQGGSYVTFTKGEPVHLPMEHLTVKVTVRIAGFKPQFPSGTAISSLTLMTGSVAPNPIETKEYIPFREGEGGVGTDYTILLPGGKNALNLCKRLKIKLQPGGYTLLEADLSSLYINWDENKHYTINLTVGKEMLEMGEVTVSDWSATQDIDSGDGGMQIII